MLGFSLYQFYQEPSWINAGGVLLDAGSLALPGIPAIGGLALRAGKTADDVAKYSVYALKEGDDIRYIGMTGRDPLLRFSEHARAGSGKEHLSPSIIYSGLTKPQARIIEQLYLNQGGLLKNGGLLNRINSVSPSSRLGQIVSNFSTGQASAVSGLLDAFAPTNATQQKALEGVVSAFGKK
jgi:hypothetical protein